MRGGLCVMAIAWSACLDSSVVVCEGGFVCPPGHVCDDVHGGCAQPEQIAACSEADELAECSYPGIDQGACYDGVCLPRGCGNKIIEPGEVCDDGNRFHGDDCSADCRSDETCGNSVVDAPLGEACDDGTHCANGESCTSDAACAGIGDGACRTRSGDGCQETCTFPTCGDGYVDAQYNEQCDDGDANSDAPNAGCRTNCQDPRCGDGTLDPSLGEVCDDGGNASGDGCSFDCQSIEECGNGYTDFLDGEQCDDGDDIRHDGCDGCRLELPSWAQPVRVPPPRGGAMAFDEARGRVVMFGGAIDGGQLDDTWEWTGARWVDVSPPVSPQARAGHAMAYDPVREEVVLFGGTGVNSHLADTWVWDGAYWREIVPPGGDWPAPRYFHAMAWDPVSERVLLHGGAATAALDETWAWDGADWTRLTPAATPGARAVHAMATDPLRNRVVLFGGLIGGTADVVEWNGTTWMTVASGSPAPTVRGYHGMSWDPIDEVVLVFGGDDGARTLDDAWAWNGASWTDVTPTPSNLLTPRTHVAAATDTVREELVAFGGMLVDVPSSTVLDVFDDTLRWDGLQWQDAAPGPDAPASSSLSLAYDAHRGRVVSLSLDELWAWHDGVWTPIATYPGPTGSTQITYDAGRDVVVVVTTKIEVWEWNPASGWSQAARSGPWPANRTDSELVYDAANEQVMLFGGAGVAGNLADTWAWSGSSWTDLTTATSPPARSGHGLAYDSRRERVVLFGGSGAAGDLADTWEWDGSQWTETTPPSSPSPRRRPAFAYDVLRERVVLFSGEAPSLLTDTWEWDGTEWTEIDPVASAPFLLNADMAYDAAAQVLVLHGSTVTGEVTWTFRYAAPGGRDDLCPAAADRDGDGLSGCDDPNCHAFCAGCGDGTCNPDLETCTMCPTDCCP